MDRGGFARCLRSSAAMLAVLAAYVVAVAWLTWPLAAHLATHLPNTTTACRVDTPLVAWALAYQSHALVGPASLANANVYHPAPLALFYGEAGFGALPYFLPTFLATGNPAIALNVMLIGSMALTACAVHAVVRRWTGSHLAGGVAGATLLTTPWVLWSVPAAPNYAVLVYFPLVIALIAGGLPGRRAMLLLVTLLVLQSAVSVYFAAAVLGPATVLAVAQLARPSMRRIGARLAGAVGLALPWLLALYGGSLLVRLRNPGLGQQSMWHFPEPHPTLLPWGPVSTAAPTGVAPAVFALIVLGLVIVALRRATDAPRSAWMHAAYWAIAGFVLSISPIVYWHEQRLVLPTIALARWTPLYEGLRVPLRLSVASLMGLSLLAGLAAAECERLVVRGTRWLRLGAVGRWAWTGAVVGVLLLGQGQGRAYSLMPAIDPRDEIAAHLRHGTGPVLEVPLGRRDVGLFAPLPHVRAMYRSIFHWRPLINGYSGYWPVGFPERLALVRRLPEATALAELRATTGLATIVVHLPRLGPGERAAWRAALADRGRRDLRLQAQGRDYLIVTVRSGPAPVSSSAVGTAAPQRTVRRDRTAVRAPRPGTAA